MDDIVKAAMAKWPNVPDCYGWLGLDARGQWFMRDDATQAQGAFACGPGEPRPTAKGSRLLHDKLLAFIHRNYTCDEAGCWFFQNGPQRVYVELEATPYVWRLQPNGQVMAHTGQLTGEVLGCWLDELGRLYLSTELGLGLMHTNDMVQAADAVEAGRWAPQNIRWADLPRLGRYVRSPLQASQASGSGP